jgi:hypothetical protein
VEEVYGRMVRAIAKKTELGALEWHRHSDNYRSLSFKEPDSGLIFVLLNWDGMLELSVKINDHADFKVREPAEVLSTIYDTVVGWFKAADEERLREIVANLEK